MRLGDGGVVARGQVPCCQHLEAMAPKRRRVLVSFQGLGLTSLWPVHDKRTTESSIADPVTLFPELPEVRCRPCNATSSISKVALQAL